MPEFTEYNETIIIRQDDLELVSEPTFNNSDIDGTYELECTVKLVQVIKSSLDAVQTKHDYVFKILNVTKLQKEV